MTRYVMVADLRRCVGCQTCTAACKETNATPPGVQWRRVLDMEAGEYPDVRRIFLPTGCQHCDEPPCMEVCPSTATRKRADGIVTIDYDICIGIGLWTIKITSWYSEKGEIRAVHISDVGHAKRVTHLCWLTSLFTVDQLPRDNNQ